MPAPDPRRKGDCRRRTTSADGSCALATRSGPPTGHAPSNNDDQANRGTDEDRSKCPVRQILPKGKGDEDDRKQDPGSDSEHPERRAQIATRLGPCWKALHGLHVVSHRREIHGAPQGDRQIGSLLHFAEPSLSRIHAVVRTMKSAHADWTSECRLSSACARTASHSVRSHSSQHACRA